MDFKTSYFAVFDQFRIDNHFDNFGQVKIDLIDFYQFWTGYS